MAGRLRPSAFTLNAASPQAPGLVVWLPLTTRTRAVDLTGSQQSTATPSGTVAYETGLDTVTEALSLPTPSGYLVPPATHALPLGSTSRTVTAWVYLNSYSVYNIPLDYGIVGTNGFRYGFFILATAPYIGVEGGLALEIYGATAYVNSAVVPLGAWTHIAVTSTSVIDSTLFYVNGVVQTTSINVGGTAIATSGTFAVFGGANDGANNPASDFDGDLTDLRVYNRVLSAAEIAAIYAADTRWDLYLPTPIGGPPSHPSPQLRRAPGLLSSG